ncbi:hypothetical protein KDI99_gp42 [Arthrobacter phage Greenhouse]|uniref:Uncharacterized protein n=1 Tax=Arthrobacter phage Greenhouse TaxID=1897428 RepID=A0A1I9SE64_9CAUD|nr:hypothetical protein KDI99_gp42 [Arthrobacter phage Greenhouse]AOZ65141.1 hypothetical protein SEA_GREENHOUSE_42 [Arthrobacter phage Greenhouse]
MTKKITKERAILTVLDHVDPEDIGWIAGALLGQAMAHKLLGKYDQKSIKEWKAADARNTDS